MMARWQHRTLLALGVAAVALASTDGILVWHNRGAQAELQARQGYLQQSAELEGLYREIVLALAELAVKHNDAQLLRVLAAQGINVTVTPPAAGAAPAAPAAAGSKR